MVKQEEKDTGAAAPKGSQIPTASDSEQKGKRMRYGILDILMTMCLVALIAATTGPRFSKASSENRLPEMVDALYAVRCQIDRYRLEHDGLLPGQDSAGGPVGGEAFVACITREDAAGRGPRLRAIPANPFVSGDAADEVAFVNAAGALPTGEEGTGWWFNAATGQFRACDSRFHTLY